MHVLMYGWEFPPHISGGLGVACHAIVTELARQHVDITLILPFTMEQGHKQNGIKLIGCDEKFSTEESGSGNIDIKYARIYSYLRPYLSVKNFNKLLANTTLKDLIDILTKINLPDELKYLIDAAINVSNPGSVEAGY